jgi:hypothetical protein
METMNSHTYRKNFHYENPYTIKTEPFIYLPSYFYVWKNYTIVHKFIWIYLEVKMR